MKNLKYWLLAVPIAAAMMVSCEADTIETGNKVDQSGYEAANENNVYLRDAKTFSTSAIAEFFAGQSEKTASVQVGIQQAVATAVSGTVSIDEAWLETYNAQNDTEYALLPADRVTIADGGAFTIAAGSLSASQVDITLTAPTEVDATGTFYALPLAVNVTAGASTSEADSHVVYLVRDQRMLGSANKGENLPKWMVLWDGGANPLNTLQWELEDGRLLFDMCVLFSGNINWNSDAGRCYLNLNPEIQWAMDNREKVLVPLQNRGVSIVLSLMNNHDSAALEGLSAEGAKDFAAEVARAVYAFDLQGVMIDTEWEARDQALVASNPYFVTNSYEAMGRLCHELKLAMPDKLILTYEWDMGYANSIHSAYQPVSGVGVGEYIDIVVGDYGRIGSEVVGEIPKSRCTRYSYITTEGRGQFGFSAANATSMIEQGYGWSMIFTSDAAQWTPTMLSRLSGTGHEAVYGSALRAPSVFYKKMDFKPYAYPAEY